MTDAARAQRPVVAAGTGRALERAERPLVQRVAESAVAGVAGEHHPAGAGGTSDRGCAGVVLAALGVGEPVRVVAELGQNPGAEDGAEPGLAEVDLSVPVPTKMLGHHRPQR